MVVVPFTGCQEHHTHTEIPGVGYSRGSLSHLIVPQGKTYVFTSFGSTYHKSVLAYSSLLFIPPKIIVLIFSRIPTLTAISHDLQSQ